MICCAGKGIVMGGTLRRYLGKFCIFVPLVFELIRQNGFIK